MLGVVANANFFLTSQHRLYGLDKNCWSQIWVFGQTIQHYLLKVKYGPPGFWAYIRRQLILGFVLSHPTDERHYVVSLFPRPLRDQPMNSLPFSLIGSLFVFALVF